MSFTDKYDEAGETAAARVGDCLVEWSRFQLEMGLSVGAAGVVGGLRCGGWVCCLEELADVAVGFPLAIPDDDDDCVAAALFDGRESVMVAVTSASEPPPAFPSLLIVDVEMMRKLFGLPSLPLLNKLLAVDEVESKLAERNVSGRPAERSGLLSCKPRLAIPGKILLFAGGCDGVLAATGEVEFVLFFVDRKEVKDGDGCDMLLSLLPEIGVDDKSETAAVVGRSVAVGVVELLCGGGVAAVLLTTGESLVLIFAFVVAATAAATGNICCCEEGRNRLAMYGGGATAAVLPVSADDVAPDEEEATAVSGAGNDDDVGGKCAGNLFTGRLVYSGFLCACVETGACVT